MWRHSRHIFSYFYFSIYRDACFGAGGVVWGREIEIIYDFVVAGSVGTFRLDSTLPLLSCVCQIYFPPDHTARGTEAQKWNTFRWGRNNRREESPRQEKHIYEVQNGLKECLRQFFLLRFPFIYSSNLPKQKLFRGEKLDTADELHFIICSSDLGNHTMSECVWHARLETKGGLYVCLRA